MKRVLSYVMTCFLCILVMAGCNQKPAKQKNTPMPAIVFDYTYCYEYTEPNMYAFMCIDKDGNIYSGSSKEYCYCKAEERMELLASLVKEQDCKLISTIQTGELQEKYDELKQIAAGDKNKITVEESMIDVCIGQHQWNGYCYDTKGDMNVVTLNGEGDSRYINDDSEAAKLADWMKQFTTAPAS